MAYRDRSRQRAAERRWYEANRQRVADKKNAKRARLRSLLRTLKSAPCADCGGSFPYYVMDFDHVDRTKVDIVSTLVHKGSVRRLLAEVAKCEVVCANCHRMRTWARLQAGQPSPVPLPTVALAGRQLSLFEAPSGVDTPPG